MLEVDYERSLRYAETAIAQGSLSLDEVRRAYLVMALSAAQLERSEEAERAFIKLFALDPEYDETKRLAPGRRTPALNARGFWAVRGKGVDLEVSFDRGSQRLFIQSDDPLGWLRTVHVWVREPGASFTKWQLAYAPRLELQLDAPPATTLQAYVFATDTFGNTIIQAGSLSDPLSFAPTEVELASVARDIRGGETGAFGRRLEELGATTSVHGYASLELGPSPDDSGFTFDLHHAAVFFRAELPPRASLEIGLELEHLATETSQLYVPHAFLDLQFFDWLVLRSGFFEAPVGAFNEYLYPDFLRTTALPPLFSGSIVPALWSEVGVQLRGRLATSAKSAVTYALFISNGLEQPDPAPGDGLVEEGGGLREMRFNVVDRYDSDKGVGGRVGLQWGGFDIGASAYTGRYTVDASRRLSLADVDFSYKENDFLLRAEGALAFQETSERVESKGGGYVQMSARVQKHLEPYLQYDFLYEQDARHRVLGGTAVYPFPESQATRTLRLKTEIGVDSGEEDSAAFVWLMQLTSGF